MFQLLIIRILVNIAAVVSAFRYGAAADRAFAAASALGLVSRSPSRTPSSSITPSTSRSISGSPSVTPSSSLSASETPSSSETPSQAPSSSVSASETVSSSAAAVLPAMSPSVSPSPLAVNSTVISGEYNMWIR